MSTIRVAGRIGRGIGLGILLGAAGVAGLLALEIAIARARRYARPEIGPGIRATLGGSGGRTIRMVMLGDSMAAGVGVQTVGDSVGGQLASLLAGPNQRVELSSVAVSGSGSADLDTQVSRALLGRRPDVAVILVGCNDALRLVNPEHAAADLASAVQRLTGAGVGVVVGTCPDLGAARALATPLRQIVGWLGRRIAAAQAPAVREAGGVPVDLAERTGAVFRADAGTLCEDGFHPSADGYRIWAHALYPAVYEAVRTVRSH